LEACLGMRQAYISQHLMALREAGILNARREGRYIYYSLKEQRLLELIQLAGELAGAPISDPFESQSTSPVSSCCCPHCEEQPAKKVEISRGSA